MNPLSQTHSEIITESKLCDVENSRPSSWFGFHIKLQVALPAVISRCHPTN